MTLDDRTVAVYSALDSATLLALLPALRYEAERAKEESDTFERVRQAIPIQTADVAEALSEAVVTKDRRSSDSACIGATDPTGRRRWRVGQGSRAAWIVIERISQARERWIRSDLVRRGLLPEYPIWGHR